MTTPFVRETMKWVAASGLDVTEMHWFDISQMPNNLEVKTDWLRDHRPPFEKCIVVWRGSTRQHAVYETVMSVVGTDPEEGIMVSLHKGAAGEMPRAVPLMVYLMDGDQLRYGPVEDDKPVQQDEAELMLALVASWYKALAQGTEAYAPTMRDTFTNRRKIKQGKAPLYDWRTVVITPCKPQPASQHKGGTHASPRQHDRRGHLRHLRNGKNVWVRPCKVGDPSKGTVFHDYEVRAA